LKNPKFLDFIGYTKEELRDEEFLYKFIHPKDIFNITESLEERDVEFRIINKDRQIKWLSGTILNHYNKQGELISLRFWLQDVSERKELEDLKSNLLTRFSHEFKTPLISIKGFTDFLLTEHPENLDDITISFLKKINKGGERLKSLINYFLVSSQLDNRLVKLNLIQENLSNLIKASLAEMEGLIKIRNHTIDLNIHYDLIAKLDKDKIRSVFTNLLLNAINYTPKGGKISIGSDLKEDNLIISIKDNGIGLSEAEKSQLFTPFGKIERYGEGWDIVTEGMGMGLYIAMGIINLHGGEIWVESEGRNKGSTFYFSLPALKY